MKWNKHFLILGLAALLLYSPNSYSACKPGPIEEITVISCSRTDPEWATLKLSTGDEVDYRAFYITYPDEKFDPETERKLLVPINPCASVPLNQPVQLRKSQRCCNPNVTDYRVRCAEIGKAWYEPPERKKFKVAIAPESSKRNPPTPALVPLVNRFGSN